MFIRGFFSPRTPDFGLQTFLCEDRTGRSEITQHNTVSPAKCVAVGFSDEAEQFKSRHSAESIACGDDGRYGNGLVCPPEWWRKSLDLFTRVGRPHLEWKSPASPGETAMKKEPFGSICAAVAGARGLFRLSCYVAVAASAVSAIAEERLTFAANAQWKVVDTSDVLVKAGSALDLSAVTAVPMVDGPPAGSQRLPRLVIGPSGKMVAKGTPDNPVRLKGFIFHVVNDEAMSVDGFGWFGEGPMWKEEVDRYVRLCRIQGYNLFRVFDIDLMSPHESLNIDPKLLDKVDYLVSQMGKQGIYLHLTLLGYGLYQQVPPPLKTNPEVQGRECDFKARMYLGDSEMRRIWLYAAETLMNHVNPYTGLAWKDDPVIACIEPYNEQESGMLARFIKSEAIIGTMNQRFRQWLGAKYQTPEALAKAWGDAAMTSFDQVAVPAGNLAFALPYFAWTGIGSSPRDQDFVLFWNELARENIAWYTANLHRIGYDGLVAHYSLPNWWGDHAARYEYSTMAIRNQFFAFPDGDWRGGSGAVCPQNSSLGDAAGYLRIMFGARFADRPFGATEYNHCFWNQYQREFGLVYGAYSAFQGFDAMVYASAPVVFDAKRLGSFQPEGSPVTRACEFLFTCVFVRGDVKTSTHRVELQVPQSVLGEFKQASTELTKLGLMSGFAISFPGVQRPKGVAEPAEPDMIVTPAGGVKSRQNGNWAIEVADAEAEKAGFQLDAMVGRMKRSGLLPESNASEPSKGVFQSDTGEITMRARENLLKVATRFTEAVTMEGGRGEPIGRLEVIGSDTPAMVGVCAVDGKELAESRRMVLLYVTETANTGMEVTPDRTKMFNYGTLPVLMKVGRLDAMLQNSHGKNMALYALGLNGARRQRLPLALGEDGRLKIHLDTASLEHGPTAFFELTVD